MTLSVIISMALFALAASISPGPVNLVSLSSSARYGAKRGLIFVTGATFGFIALFLFIGFSLHYLIAQLAWITGVLQWLGIAFLLYLSYQLFIDDGGLTADAKQNAPTFMTGVIMQWLNPKAWLASLSGIAAYSPGAQGFELVTFASLYLPICWLSLGCWVWLGIRLGQHFQSPAKMRVMNKILALLLAGSCFLLLI
ncbi:MULTISPECIES: LysE family translocator [Pseudoalteromonas]|uniref:LysE family translocator n=1 Tax=Pseudoalteromonas TaxID=53246 RepID=UPI001602B456|nr:MULTISPECIES: LysE family translocator [Pseudoalteromonas]MBB1293411.1 LysE family translocator [Pseudoalteromonas sp. SR41-4]MBB1302923.1 LysE family translocator [Pseudoalteromonas sp. SR44-8]MBB1310361.1 LysE family translocator [Pseudoalteromonas sp. SR41-8]MBB1397762.1 LysE family translocator [Pseudoalteromonas sp. SG44-8]|tara:strand:+ start:11661 stop:12251 length:591 start_codon:yes stop_codon:yes gene_type:complete